MCEEWYNLIRRLLEMKTSSLTRVVHLFSISFWCDTGYTNTVDHFRITLQFQWKITKVEALCEKMQQMYENLAQSLDFKLLFAGTVQSVIQKWSNGEFILKIYSWKEYLFYMLRLG